MEKENKKRITKNIIIVILIVILLLVVGIAYGYFSNKSLSSENIVKAGTLIINYEDDNLNTLSLDNIVPIYDSEITTKAGKIDFTITNDGSNSAYVNLNLININMSKDLAENSMYWQLNSGDTVIDKGNFGCHKELVNAKQTISNNQILNSGESKSYTLYVYMLENNKNQSDMMNKNLNLTIEVSSSGNYNGKTYNLGTCVNEPDLMDNTLIPVAYDNDISAWVRADTTKEWYNYGKQEWANAVTVAKDASTCTGNCQDSIEKHNRDYYINAEVNTPISMDDIETMWVWIPRYKYRITEKYDTHLNDNTATQQLPGAIDVVFENGVESTGVDGALEEAAVTKYYTHPAFRDGSKVYKNEPYDLGGWDSELTGIWVAKFETSSDCLNNPSTSTNSDCINNGGGNTTNEKALVKPNMKSWSSINVGNEFAVSRTLSAENNSYGISTSSNSHMLKNTEWGMIAYLSQSKYGKYGNNNYTGADKEIAINNCSKIV